MSSSCKSQDAGLRNFNPEPGDIDSSGINHFSRSVDSSGKKKKTKAFIFRARGRKDVKGADKLIKKENT